MLNWLYRGNFLQHILKVYGISFLFLLGLSFAAVRSTGMSLSERLLFCVQFSFVLTLLAVLMLTVRRRRFLRNNPK